eukprot:9120962-Heterocapsa_arctica.AAC.1
MASDGDEGQQTTGSPQPGYWSYWDEGKHNIVILDEDNLEVPDGSPDPLDALIAKAKVGAKVKVNSKGKGKDKDMAKGKVKAKGKDKDKANSKGK